MEHKLICTNCGIEYDTEPASTRCEECNEPLEMEIVSNGEIDNSIGFENSFKRYLKFFPYIKFDSNVSLGEGFTPLVKTNTCNSWYLKIEGSNPSWSFKDRGTLTGVLKALELGYKKIGTVSTGNMAASVAAYGAKSNLETYILVKDEIAEEKIGPIGIYGPKLIKVKGNYGELYKNSIKIGRDNGIYFINSDAPFRVEGYKTTAFEIYEQLGGKVPDYVLVPTSAGGNIRGIEKGFRELNASGLTNVIPRFIAVQAKGCNPIVRGYRSGNLQVERIENPETIAHAIENPFPPSGNQVLRMLKSNDGMAIDIEEDEIIEAQRELAHMGQFVQPASATSYAALKKLFNEGFISMDDVVVCVLTASGLKYTQSLEMHKIDVRSCSLDDLEENLK